MGRINQSGKIGFGRAVKDFFFGYFSFSGRTSRAGFWFAALFLAIIFVPVIMLFAAVQLILQSIPYTGRPSFYFNPFFYLGFILGIGVIFPVLALLARRMRDAGMKNYSTVLFLLFFALTGLAILNNLLFVFQANEAVDFLLFISTFFFVVAFFIFSLLPADYFREEAAFVAESGL